MAFEALPDALRAGWTVVDEPKEAYENPKELQIRYQIAHFHDASCQDLFKKIRTAETPVQFEEAVKGFDVAAISQEQFAELCFTFGARFPTHFIRTVLQKATDDDDIESLAAFSQIRHLLFEENLSHS